MIKVLNQTELMLAANWIQSIQQVGFWWTLPELIDLLKTTEIMGDLDESGNLRGFVAVQNLGEALDLVVLAVDPRFQRQGVMRHLLAHLVAVQESSPSEAKALWLEVHEGNVAARNFYEKMGFLQSGKRPKYYRDGGTALLFSRAIDLPLASG